MSLRGKQANGLVTQQRVLRAAVAQFLEKGYTGTTTSDITGAAGIAQSSFFHVFPSKEALLLELVRRMFGGQFDLAGQHSGAADPVFLYAVEDGAFTFYCHSAKEGKKLDVIRKNASVAFEMDCQNALQHGETACTHSYYYASVLGEGKAEILEGERNVLYALNCIKPPITLVMRPPSLYQRNRRFFLLPKLLSFKKTVCCFCQNTLNSPRASGSSPPYRLK